MSAAGDTGLALKLLYAAATSGFWADRENELSKQIVHLVESLAVPDDDPWLTAVLAYAAPIDRGEAVIERVRRTAPNPGEPDAMLLWVSAAAATVGAFDLAEPYAAASVEGLREHGRLGALAQALVLRAWSEIHIGRWDVALPDAEEAERLAQETGQPIWGGGAQVALSILAGLREIRTRPKRSPGALNKSGFSSAREPCSVLQLARGLTAFGAGRHEDAYVHLRRMFNPSDPAYHRMESCWAIGNLAEAAVRSGHNDEAREVLEQVELLTRRTPSPWLHVAMRHARALLADDSDAEAL